MKVENAFKTVRAELERKYLEGLKVIQKPKKVGKRSNLPKSGVQILKQWLFDHFLHPYPTEEEKVQLAAQTNLGVQQVNNWFINARVRIWKPESFSRNRDRWPTGLVAHAQPTISISGLRMHTLGLLIRSECMPLHACPNC